jgi:hypothetical protein
MTREEMERHRSIPADQWTGKGFKPVSEDAAGQVHAPVVRSVDGANAAVPAFKPATDPTKVYAPVVPAVPGETYKREEHPRG